MQKMVFRVFSFRLPGPVVWLQLFLTHRRRRRQPSRWAAGIPVQIKRAAWRWWESSSGGRSWLQEFTADLREADEDSRCWATRQLSITYYSNCVCGVMVCRMCADSPTERELKVASDLKMFSLRPKLHSSFQCNKYRDGKLLWLA